MRTAMAIADWRGHERDLPLRDLQTRGDVDPVAENVVSLDQYVAVMDTDAPIHSALGGGPGITFRRQPLQRQRTLDGADHRAELDQYPVASGLDDATGMLGNERNGGSAMLAYCPHRTRLVQTH